MTSAFNDHAEHYDALWGQDPVARRMRTTVQEVVRRHVPRGARVLDGGCGVGLDARWLLRDGYEVVAIDASAGMVAAARQNAPGVDARVLPLEDVGCLAPEGPFDGALLDFGVLNLVELAPAAEGLARSLRPGACVVAVPMPRLAPTFVLGLLRHGRVRTALGRLRAERDIAVEGVPVRTRYLGSRALLDAFAPWFEPVERLGMGFLMPAPGSRASAARLALTERVERRLRGLPVLREMGDHLVVVMRRRPETLGRPPSADVGPLSRRLRTRKARRTGQLTRLHTVIFELTQGCQSRCVGCGFRGPAGGEALTASRVGELAREAAAMGAERALLTGGEPLLRPDLEEVLEVICAAGLAPCLLTNGLALARHAAVVGKACPEVIVSLDGHDASSYRQARGVDGFAAVGRGIAALRAAAPAVRIGARVTVGPGNAGQLFQIAEAARELGCDTVSFLAMDVDNIEAFGERTAVPSRPGATALREELAALRAALPDDVLVDSPYALDRIWKLAAGDGEAAAPPCDAPFTTALVGSDLSLRPCFFLPPHGSAADGLQAGLARAAPELRALDQTTEPACRSCVCWARLT